MATAATKQEAAVAPERGVGEPAGEPRSDDTHSYLHRLTRCKLLTPEEEVRLARRIAAGDGTAKAHLVESNLRLVASVAKAYRSCGIPLEDLIQEGTLGLITAAERFDPEHGCRFSTYATPWIRQAIGRAVQDKAGLPPRAAESLRTIHRARADLRRELGEDPTPEQLAARTGMAEGEVLSLLSVSREPISLDLPVGEAQDASLGSLLWDEASPDPQQELISAERRQQIGALLATLGELERRILCRRFGFDGGGGPYVLEQLARELQLSRQRVCQIEARALKKLRAAARQRHLREYLEG